jgi:CRISPR-associated protein Csm5
VSTYRITCLTPTLAGDGKHLAPIDYMLWRDQVNVLDHERILRMWSRSPRLESYLAQVRRAERLDFENWGGLAQNFAGRRIPLEDASMSPFVERAPADRLFIPTFMTTAAGHYLPGSVIKGALRSALLLDRVQEGHWKQLGQLLDGDRPVRRPGEALEGAVLGLGGSARTRSLLVSDSSPIPTGSTKVYLLRAATLLARGEKRELGWKTASRGNVEGRRHPDSAPYFAEMAAPGTAFTGLWQESVGLSNPTVARGLRWKQPLPTAEWLAAANRAAERILAAQKTWAESVGLATVAATVNKLDERRREIAGNGISCLLCIGWGGGLLGKAAYVSAQDPPAGEVLRRLPGISTLLRTGMPVPKTRRIVFLRNFPATLPGWVQLDLIN